MEENEEKQELIVNSKVSGNLRSWGLLLCYIGWLSLIVSFISLIFFLTDVIDFYLSVYFICGFFTLVPFGQILRGISKIAYASECDVAMIEEKRKVKKIFE